MFIRTTIQQPLHAFSEHLIKITRYARSLGRITKFRLQPRLIRDVEAPAAVPGQMIQQASLRPGNSSRMYHHNRAADPLGACTRCGWAPNLMSRNPPVWRRQIPRSLDQSLRPATACANADESTGQHHRKAHPLHQAMGAQLSRASVPLPNGREACDSTVDPVAPIPCSATPPVGNPGPWPVAAYPPARPAARQMSSRANAMIHTHAPLAHHRHEHPTRPHCVDFAATPRAAWQPAPRRRDRAPRPTGRWSRRRVGATKLRRSKRCSQCLPTCWTERSWTRRLLLVFLGAWFEN